MGTVRSVLLLCMAAAGDLWSNENSGVSICGTDRGPVRALQGIADCGLLKGSRCDNPSNRSKASDRERRHSRILRGPWLCGIERGICAALTVDPMEREIHRA